MENASVMALKARKTPMQRRSSATVSAIFEATIQLLLARGLNGLTTTRVADRAGVSVGTLYQYFPNKRALLAAVLERHLDTIATSIESACLERHGETVSNMVAALCNAYIDAKSARLDASLALYRVAAELDGDALARIASQRSQRALIDMLGTASDATFGDLTTPAMVLVTAMTGPVHAVMDAGADGAMLDALRHELFELGLGYLQQVLARQRRHAR